MRIQLLSDLHLETEPFEPQPAPDADLLILAARPSMGKSALARIPSGRITSAR